MRDPADTTVSPYDVLGLAPGAGQKDINDSLASFLKDPAKKPRMREAMDARKRLTDPVERLAVDFFQYDPADASDAAAIRSDLDGGRRVPLGERWEQARAGRVGADPRVDHNLAVLCWWQGVAEEARATAGSPQGPEAAWLRAIPNLVFVAYLPGYWQAAQQRLAALGNTQAGGDDVAAAARRRVLDEVSVRMSAYLTAAQERRQADHIGRWTTLRTQFDVERTSTEELAQLIREGHFQDLRPCGPLLAGLFNGREFIHGRLASGEVPRPRVAKLLTYFSPVGRAQLLVDEQRFDEAARELEALPEAVRKQPECQALLAALGLSRGKELLARTETRLAGIQALAEAAVYARRGGDEAVRKLADAGRDLAAGWVNRGDYGSALAVLEPLYENTADIALRDLLIVCYSARGSIRAEQGKQTRDPLSLLDAIADLETCLALDSGHAKSRQYLEIASGWLAAEVAMHGHPKEAAGYAQAVLRDQKIPRADVEAVFQKPPGKSKVLNVTLSDSRGGGSGISYSMPPLCACCAENGPTKKREITGTRQEGNMKYTMRMTLPYCEGCDRHLRHYDYRIWIGILTFIILALLHFNLLIPHLDEGLANGASDTPGLLAAAFWGLHILGALCIAIRLPHIFFPEIKLSERHAGDTPAGIGAFSNTSVKVWFHNPWFGMEFAMTNRPVTSEVSA